MSDFRRSYHQQVLERLHIDHNNKAFVEHFDNIERIGLAQLEKRAKIATKKIVAARCLLSELVQVWKALDPEQLDLALKFRASAKGIEAKAEKEIDYIIQVFRAKHHLDRLRISHGSKLPVKYEGLRAMFGTADADAQITSAMSEHIRGSYDIRAVTTEDPSAAVYLNFDRDHPGGTDYESFRLDYGASATEAQREAIQRIGAEAYLVQQSRLNSVVEVYLAFGKIQERKNKSKKKAQDYVSKLQSEQGGPMEQVQKGAPKAQAKRDVPVLVETPHIVSLQEYNTTLELVKHFWTVFSLHEPKLNDYGQSVLKGFVLVLEQHQKTFETIHSQRLILFKNSTVTKFTSAIIAHRSMYPNSSCLKKLKGEAVLEVYSDELAVYIFTIMDDMLDDVFRMLNERGSGGKSFFKGLKHSHWKSSPSSTGPEPSSSNLPNHKTI